MDNQMKRFVLSVSAYLILVFIIAVTWHVVLFNQQYLSFGMRKEPIFHLGILSMIIQGLISAYLFPKVAKENSPIYEGLKFGLIIAFFMGSYGVLAEAGKYNVGSVSSYICYEGAFFVIQYAIVGVVIGLIHGKKFKAN
jgi:hypothetical protein